MKLKINQIFFVLITALTACGQTTNAPRLRGAAVFAQTTNAPVFYLPEARSYFTRANIGDRQVQRIVNQLVVDLKAANVWTNLLALHLYLGGNAESAAVNLVGTNYTITWNGGVTFNNYGVTGDGSTGYGDTGFKPSTLANTSFHLYSAGSQLYTQAVARVMAGAQASMPLSRYQMIAASFADNVSSAFGGVVNTNGSSFQYVYQDSYPIVMLSWLPDRMFVWNGVSAVATNAFFGPVMATNNLYVLARSGNSGASLHAHATLFATSFGYGFTQAQATNYFTALNKFLTAMGRQPIRLRASSVFTPSTNAPSLPRANRAPVLTVNESGILSWSFAPALPEKWVIMTSNLSGTVVDILGDVDGTEFTYNVSGEDPALYWVYGAKDEGESYTAQTLNSNKVQY